MFEDYNVIEDINVAKIDHVIRMKQALSVYEERKHKWEQDKKDIKMLEKAKNILQYGGYYQKYIKYKRKYINSGGNKKVFDLSQQPLTGSLQENLKYVHSKFGESFNIKWDKLIIPVKFYLNICKLNGKKFYEMVYDLKENTKSLFPFLIVFIDTNTGIVGETTYIANIHKTDKISGSTMVKFVLELQRILGVKKTFLHDGASVPCGDEDGMNLSWFKFIEKNRGFYMKFGFQIEMSKRDGVFKYNNMEDLKSDLDDTLKKIRKIKVADVIKERQNIIDIIAFATKEQDKDSFKIKYLNEPPIFEKNLDYFYTNPFGTIPRLFTESYSVLGILNETKETYLHKYLSKLFNDPKTCQKYNDLTRILCVSGISNIYYKKKEVKLKYADLFYKYKFIKGMYIYAYYFDQ